MRAIVVDDEQLIGEHICRMLTGAGVEVLGCYTNPIAALEMIGKFQPNVIFLDIEMPEMSGLELAEKIYSGKLETEIVFITAYNQYAIEAFRVNALDYLLKPVMPEDIKQTVERVRKRIGAQNRNHIDSQNRRIRISLFGNLSVYVDDNPKPIRWVTAKCAELFAYMLLQKKDEEVSKWKLIDALWQEKNLEKADINLRSTISRLNKTLRENFSGLTLVSTRNGYLLESNERNIEIDAFQLEQLVLNAIVIDSINVKHYEKVVFNYSALLLEEFSGAWCEATRQTYHRYFLHAAQQLVHYYEEVGAEPLKILKLIEIMVQHEPYDDSLREMEMRLHFRVFGKKQVVHYYREYREFLKRDLGMEPSESMNKLYHVLQE